MDDFEVRPLVCDYKTCRAALLCLASPFPKDVSFECPRCKQTIYFCITPNDCDHAWVYKVSCMYCYKETGIPVCGEGSLKAYIRYARNQNAKQSKRKRDTVP